MSNHESRSVDERFESSLELLEAIKVQAGQIVGVSIVVGDEILRNGPNGERIIDASSLIEMTDGRILILPRDQLELILNDGLLQRLSVPISLIAHKPR